LRANGFVVEEGQEFPGGTWNSPLSVMQRLIYVDGERIRVEIYDSSEVMERASDLIGITSVRNPEYPHVPTAQITWAPEASPRWFKRDLIIVHYSRNESRIVDFLMENLTFFVGRDYPNRGEPLEREGIPGRSPHLYVSLSTAGLPTQNFRAAQGSTSWFLVYDASAEHPLDFWRETWDCIDFNAFIGQFEGTDSGEIDLRFSHVPPDTMYVRRWRTEFIGMASEMWDIYEPVEVNDNIIRINDSGYDYIYQVEARWERGGWASYTFRINSTM
jgi:hypothetical protein